VNSTFWSIPPEWTSEPCFILVGGPSLKGFDAEILRGAGRIIVVNNAYQLCPFADVLYFCDAAWWNTLDPDRHVTHRDDVLTNFTGQHIVSMGTSQDNVHRVQHGGMTGLSTSPSALCHGGNGGYQAIDLAVHLGALRIYLLGYDMHGGHWHSPHPGSTSQDKFEAKMKNDWVPRFSTLVGPLASAGVTVTNCTPGSLIKCFPFMSIEDAVQHELQIKHELAHAITA
jgi:hypothetical protein